MNKKPEPIQVTPEKALQIENELQDLKSKLPAMIKETGEMAALGDRSENAGYQNAKALMRRTQRRIFYLERLSKRIVIVKNTVNGTIQVGSKVYLENTISGQTESYNIVGQIEADPLNFKISTKSPLGSLLLGKKVGNIVTLELPVNKVIYKITKVE